MKRNPQNPTVVHLISHNHWDREWIFQAEYVNQWLPSFFEHLFEMLQTQPDYLFVLDGQTCIIEDYLNQLSEEEAAEKAQKIKEYAQAGRLMVGSAYIQQDWGLVSGEALVRNFLTGIRMANELGGVMRVGWLLDNFGQIAQAPQICCGFDIDGVFVWRGPELPPESIRTEFQWQAP
ncbi:alpha-mannosidase, partial [candidate division KSB1 bacterium]|nr:alpha-mannosidase [candidate division KSB1 bacterium]NIR71900.1 alpha-mannosidase [candidate division KSB1 bacterium]NIS23790.1 alpha-mannosidase [candidate division KSB1 bacterium]NIT70713.1 alpha-mannosidase [candidate division KSB1 bacterium]NIU24440.1 alpha-mannosidase [candidate division KSB1 bacterium]